MSINSNLRVNGVILYDNMLNFYQHQNQQSKSKKKLKDTNKKSFKEVIEEVVKSNK